MTAANDSVPHLTRFDDEIVRGLADIPLEWTLDSGRVLRRSGPPHTAFEDLADRSYAAYERPLKLPAVPGSRDPFKRDSEIWYEAPGGSPERAAHGPSFAPQVVLLPNAAALVVFRCGVKEPPVPPAGHSWTADEAYLRKREGAGTSIGYAYRDPTSGGWHHGVVAAAEEVLVREGMERDTFEGRLYPMLETLGPPALGLDGHGVPWCLWANPVRRHVYFARWLGPGHGFSAPLEARGAYYALDAYVAVEMRAPAGAPDILAAATAGGKVHLFSLPVSSLDTSQRRHILMLDLLEVAELSGIEHCLGQAEKRPENPLVTPQQVAEARNEPLRPLGAPQVWRHDGALRMELGGRGPMGGGATGLLASDDGLRWQLLPDRPTLDGAVPEGDWCVTWFEDVDEADPERRYKGALIRGNWISDRQRWLATSPDGLQWRTAGEMSGMHHLKEHGGPSFHDTATGEYVAVSRTSATGGRALGMLRSPDLVNWSGEEALLDPRDPYGQPAQLWRGQLVAGRILDPSGECGAEQIYWGTVWPDNDLYLCLYGRYRWDARYDAALAVSRDGRNFMRIHNGQSLVPVGAPGEWDSGIVFMDFGVTRPVAFSEQGIVRLYYAGSSWRHGADPYRAPSAVGAADLRIDGWAYLQPRRDAPLPATVTTIPITAAGPATLRVNADGPRHWEYLDAATGALLPELPSAGRFRVRFSLDSDRTRLYSFWFEPSEHGPAPSSNSRRW